MNAQWGLSYALTVSLSLSLIHPAIYDVVLCLVYFFAFLFLQFLLLSVFSHVYAIRAQKAPRPAATATLHLLHHRRQGFIGAARKKQRSRSHNLKCARNKAYPVLFAATDSFIHA